MPVFFFFFFFFYQRVYFLVICLDKAIGNPEYSVMKDENLCISKY